MIKTEKKYWKNGYSKRGKDFKTFTFRILSLGVLLCNYKPLIQFYSLTK